jgi:hypothetical protein
MKRDMDLVRSILIEMEKWTPDQRGGEIKVQGHTPEEITYHLGLMHEAELIEASEASNLDGEAWLPIKIRWDGHEFLDAARSDTVWTKAKQRAMSTAGTLTLEAMKAALPWVIRQAVSST